MKRFRLLLAGVLMTVTLCLFVFAGMASASPAHRCTSHWHIVSSAPITTDDVQASHLGTVSLLCDGCGNIRARLHVSATVDKYGFDVSTFDLYLVDAHNNMIGADTSSGNAIDLKTAVSHHYSGIRVSAVGWIVRSSGEAVSHYAGQTPYNSGK